MRTRPFLQLTETIRWAEPWAFEEDDDDELVSTSCGPATAGTGDGV